MTSPNWTSRRWVPALAFALTTLAGLASFGGCGSGNHPSEVNEPDAVALFDSGLIQDATQQETDVCAQPGFHEGCACPTEGAQMECGSIVKKDGGYVTCSVGHATCTGGKWGTCAGDHFEIKSTSKQTLYGGTQPLYISGTCANVCDPNPNCTSLTGQTDDVLDGGADVGLYAAPDGGITLDPGDGGGTGPNCKGMWCFVRVCSGKADGTTISGVVTDPAGKNPLYGATVYIPVDTTGAIPDFTSGVTCDTCSGATLNAVSVATTKPDGTFTLKNVPVGVRTPIVVQMGKWRREIVLNPITTPCTDVTSVASCTATDPSMCTLRLPRNQRDGYNPKYASGITDYSHADLPQIAMVSGSADPLECILMKAGISTSEIGSAASDTTGSKRLHFFHSARAPGAKLDPAYGTQQDSSALWRDSSWTTKTPNHYSFYDVVLDACEGSAIDKKNISGGTGNPYQNLINYTNAGGRAFVTHFGYVWLAYPSAYTGYATAPDNWSGVATWRHLTGTTYTDDPMRATINTSFTKGSDYSKWLDVVGASVSTGSNRLDLHEARYDLSAVGANTQAWMTARPYSGAPNFPPHFTFNTPYGATGGAQCGRVVYSDFHVSANALVGSTNSCTDGSTCGFGQTCIGGSPVITGNCVEPCATNADCKDSTYSCCKSATGTCDPPSKGNCTAKTCSPSNYTCTVGVPNDANSACVCTDDRQCRSGKCAPSMAHGVATCSAPNCTGDPAKADVNGCQQDAPVLCDYSSSFKCTNTKFNSTCTTGAGNCPITPGTVYTSGGTHCTDATKVCNASGSACACTH